jgi:hypothetical protein
MSIRHRCEGGVPLLLAFALLPGMALALLVGSVGSADAYACGDPSQNHCYGINVWSRPSEFFGAYTDITQVQMACPSGCGGFVDDEIWLIDRSSSACTSNAFKMCWVEAGTITTEGGNPTFFWADARPGTGNTFNLHYLGGADPVGTVNHYMIIKDGRTSPNNYLVFVYNDSQSTLYNGVSSVAGAGGCGSTPPQMVGTEINIGQELAGAPAAANNASAGRASFTRNIWAVQALDAAYVFWYNAQTGVSASSQNPPTASWAQNPGAPGAPEGGQFTTQCC